VAEANPLQTAAAGAVVAVVAEAAANHRPVAAEAEVAAENHHRTAVGAVVVAVEARSTPGVGNHRQMGAAD
jgi:hypothetical protein